jgi:uncharacterized protein (DUF1697 family)
MNTYIAILRGINVGGNKPMKMDALKSILDEIGLKNVTTYIQSGNIVFNTKEKDTKFLEQAIYNTILVEFEFEVPVMVFDIQKMGIVLKNNPFHDESYFDPSFLHVTFLASIPEAILLPKVLEILSNQDAIKIVNDIVYLYCPNGYSNTTWSNTFLEKKLKVKATTRNWKTCMELNKIGANIK